MTGQIKVDILNQSGIFVSGIDTDPAFKDSTNTDGTFVMAIEPFHGFNKGLIYYQKIEDGYVVEGEGYILSAPKDKLPALIRKWKRRHRKREYLCVEFLEKEFL